MRSGSNSEDTRIDWVAVRRRMQHADAAIQDALHPTAERAKAIMDARARVLAQSAKAPASRRTVLDVVLFTLGAERYAIETRYVREVVRFADFTPVPGAPGFVIGVTNLRGSILEVVDVRVLLNVTQKGLTDLSRILVLGTETVDFGIVVDQADGQAELPVDDLLDPPDAIGFQRGLLRGVMRDALIVLDGKILLQDERLQINHA